MFYRFVRMLCKILLAPLYFPKVEGKQWTRLQGPAVVICNHNSMKDIPVLSAAFHPTLIYLGKEQLFHNKCLGWIFHKLGGIPLRRGEADLTAVRCAMKVLKDGGVLALFPEGTRSKTGQPGPFEPGAAFLVLRGGVPVIPVAIHTPYHLFHRLRVTVGEPMDFTEYTFWNKEEKPIEAVTQRMQERIYGMLGTQCKPR